MKKNKWLLWHSCFKKTINPKGQKRLCSAFTKRGLKYYSLFSVRALEKARNTGQFAQASGVGFDGSESESSIEGDLAQGRRKKIKME
jgi:hypothetical protein